MQAFAYRTSPGANASTHSRIARHLAQRRRQAALDDNVLQKLGVDAAPHGAHCAGKERRVLRCTVSHGLTRHACVASLVEGFAVQRDGLNQFFMALSLKLSFDVLAHLSRCRATSHCEAADSARALGNARCTLGLNGKLRSLLEVACHLGSLSGFGEVGGFPCLADKRQNGRHKRAQAVCANHQHTAGRLGELPRLRLEHVTRRNILARNLPALGHVVADRLSNAGKQVLTLELFGSGGFVCQPCQRLTDKTLPHVANAGQCRRAEGFGHVAGRGASTHRIRLGDSAGASIVAHNGFVVGPLRPLGLRACICAQDGRDVLLRLKRKVFKRIAAILCGSGNRQANSAGACVVGSQRKPFVTEHGKLLVKVGPAERLVVLSIRLEAYRVPLNPGQLCRLRAGCRHNLSDADSALAGRDDVAVFVGLPPARLLPKKPVKG